MNKWFPSVLMLLLACGASGCTSALGVWPVAQSHVSYPETKIAPLGETKATARDFEFTLSGVPDIMHPDIAHRAVHDAIAAKGGDLLTDYTLSLYVTQIPFGLFIAGVNGWVITWTAEGTAAKLEFVKPGQPVPSPGTAPKSEQEPRR